MCNHQCIISWSSRPRTQRSDTIELAAEGDRRLLLRHGVSARSTQLPKHATHCLLLLLLRGNNRMATVQNKKTWNSPQTFIVSHECSEWKFSICILLLLRHVFCLSCYCQLVILFLLLFSLKLKCETIISVMSHSPVVHKCFEGAYCFHVQDRIVSQ
jgi:hypothetical protein